MSIWTNIKNRGFKDLLNPKRWVMVLDSFRGKTVGTTLKIGDENVNFTNEQLQSYIEQVSYRQSFEECRRCLNEGACTHCGCDRSLFLDPKMVCSGGNWQEIKTPEEWRKFKKTLELEEEYGSA